LPHLFSGHEKQWALVSPQIGGEPDLPNYWALLINRWQLMGLTVLVAVILVGGWIVFRVPLYTASAILLIEPPQTLAERIDAEDAQDRYYQRQVDLLSSPAFAAEVITGLNLEANTAFAEAQTKYVGFGRLGVCVAPSSAAPSPTKQPGGASFGCLFRLLPSFWS